MSVLTVLAVGVAAFGAATVAGVSGFGGAVVLLPVLVWALGARDAVVVLTVAQLAGNGSRVAFNRRELDRAVLARFALGAVPAAVLGGFVFAAVPASALTRLLGGFLLASVAWRHIRQRTPRRPPLASFPFIGALAGLLSAVLGTVGPLLAPFFLAYGLLKGAYIGTEAACAVVMHTTKVIAYGGAGVLSGAAAVAGLALAPAMVAGSFAGRRLLNRVCEHTFVVLIEGTLVVSGSLLLVGG